MIETSSDLYQMSSAIFGNFFQNIQKRSCDLRTTFVEFSEIFRKSTKMSLLVCLYHKQNSTWSLEDWNFSSQVQCYTNEISS